MAFKRKTNANANVKEDVLAYLYEDKHDRGILGKRR